MNFQPHNEKSYVDMLWEVARDLPVGGMITLNDPRVPFSIADRRHVITQVAKRMEKEQQRTLMSVRGEGYKVVSGTSHTHQVRRFLKKAQKAARRTHHSASNVNMREMSGTEQVEAAELAQRAEFLARAANSTSRKLDPPTFLENAE